MLSRARDVSAYAQRLFPGFQTAFEAAPVKDTLTVGGVAFSIASDLENYVSLAREALVVTPIEKAPPAQILIAGKGDLPGIPPVPFWEGQFFDAYRMCNKFEATNLRIYHYQERGFWQFYDRASGRGVQIMSGRDSYPEWDPGSPLRNLLGWHLNSPGQGFVHAGTLGEDGTGIMLAGPGGSGKSGTVLAGLLAGMQSVGDDYVLARTPATGGVTTLPIFNTLKCDPDGLARLGLTSGNGKAKSPIGSLNWQGKYQFSFDDIGERAPSPSLNITALLVPSVTGDSATVIEPMPRREAFLALAKSGFIQMPGDKRHSLTFCSEIIKRLPTYRILLGNNPGEIISCLRSFLRMGTGQHRVENT